MQCTFDAGTIIVGELTDAFHYVVDVFGRNLCFAKRQLPICETGLRFAAQVEYNFE